MVQKLTGTINEKHVDQINNALKSGERLELHIDSSGGDLFSGLAIYNALSNYDPGVDIYVDNIAGSIASVIALAGKQPPTIAQNGSIAIHNAHVERTSGNHNDLRKIADSLQKYSEIVANIYATKTKRSLDDVLQAMNEETVFNSREAQAFGLAGDIFNPVKAFAQINKIDMKLIDTIREKLKNEVAPVVVAPLNEEHVPGEDPAEEGAGFSPEQLQEISAIVAELIAEALAGQSEEVGNTIATVFNEIRSKGTLPVKNKIDAPSNVQEGDAGLMAFYKKMDEIKTR